jgi:hypothetical protein
MASGHLKTNKKRMKQVKNSGQKLGSALSK